MRSVVVVSVLAWLLAGIARADEPTELHDDAPGGLVRDPSEPLLHLDIDTPLRANREGFDAHGIDADVTRERALFELGPHTRASLEADAWTRPLLSTEGWGTTLRLAHDFKVFQFVAEVGYHRVDSGDAHGSYTLIGASLIKTKRLSRWMTAWISLTIGRRMWLGTEPPPGEKNDTAAMLSIGTTFR